MEVEEHAAGGGAMPLVLGSMDKLNRLVERTRAWQARLLWSLCLLLHGFNE